MFLLCLQDSITSPTIKQSFSEQAYHPVWSAKDEVKIAFFFFNFGTNISLGPDGVAADIFKCAWGVVKSDPVTNLTLM